MTQRVLFARLLLLTLIHCDPNRTPVHSAVPDTAHHIAAANDLTGRFSRSRLSSWNIRASASGADCAVLFVEVPIVLDDSMVEAMHYGAGAYAIDGAGVQRFADERSFRAVTYEDKSRRRWAYGLSRGEAESLAPCQ